MYLSEVGPLLELLVYPEVSRDFCLKSLFVFGEVFVCADGLSVFGIGEH